MKIFYWLIPILFAIALHVQAQSFSLSNLDGSAINNGDTIIVTGTSDIEIRGYVVLTNNATSIKTVKLKKTELWIVPGTGNAFAWDQAEYSPWTTVSAGNTIAALSKDSSFISFFFPLFLPGTSFIQYTFFDQDNPSDSAWMVIEYQVSQVSAIAGINTPSINIFPNPVHGMVTIILSQAGVKTIPVRIYNSLGEIVYADFTQQDRVTLDTSPFPKGYYTIEAGKTRMKLLKQ